MLFIYAVFMLFYNFCIIIKQHKMTKKNLLTDVVTLKEQKKLFFIMGVVFVILLAIIGYQSFGFFNSIFQMDIEELIEVPLFLQEYVVYGNIGLKLLKIIWIPTKITKYVLQVIFGTLSIFVYFSHACLEDNKKLPKYLRNILYLIFVLNIIFIVVSLF